jgi:hypothetical protein
MGTPVDVAIHTRIIFLACDGAMFFTVTGDVARHSKDDDVDSTNLDTF